VQMKELKKELNLVPNLVQRKEPKKELRMGLLRYDVCGDVCDHGLCDHGLCDHDVCDDHDDRGVLIPLRRVRDDARDDDDARDGDDVHGDDDVHESTIVF